MKKVIKKGIKIAAIGIFSIVLLFFMIRGIGLTINRQVPSHGINESMYVEINGTKQWINIYGDDINNPVLLYLHGGPGSSTSDIDYAFTRKWADVYTVVTWDQRNCGKSYDKSQDDLLLTKDLFMEDGKQMTEYIREYLSVDKITILGHSWGSIYGANLVLEYPEYYECFIGTGQLVDAIENEEAFKEEATIWAAGDREAMELVEQLTPEKLTAEHINARNALMNKYGYNMMKDGSDYNLIATVVFNPNYSLVDWIKYFSRNMDAYFEFFCSKDFEDFSLTGRTTYKVPYFNINGDMDYQTNYKLAQEYFDSIAAPYKEMYIMKDTTHGLLESKSDEFSEYVHKIAATMENRR